MKQSCIIKEADMSKHVCLITNIHFKKHVQCVPAVPRESCSLSGSVGTRSGEIVLGVKCHRVRDESLN